MIPVDPRLIDSGPLVEARVIARHNGIPTERVIERYRRAMEEVGRFRQKVYAEHAKKFEAASRRIRAFERKTLGRLGKRLDFAGLRRKRKQ